MEKDTTLLALNGVTKKFHSPGPGGPLEVLKSVNLSVLHGDSISIVGPSGCGKSTLLNIIGGLDAPDSGTVKIDGCNLYELRSAQLAEFRNKSVGFLFQNHHLLPQCSVIENVLIPGLATSSSPSLEMRERGETLLEKIGLSDRIHHRPSQLSGGERQRVAFVRSLIMKPQFILADEPTGSLDPKTAETMTELLIEMNETSGLTMIIVTHSMELAGRMKRKVSFSDGALVEA